MKVEIRVVAVTISDRRARGAAEDVSGAVLLECLREINSVIIEQIIVPDDFEKIVEVLKTRAPTVNLIVTTGGTGFAPRDVTPEATRAAIEREAPGLAEAMRAATVQKTPTAILSRAVCGIRESCLIVNLPGSPKAVRECFDAIKNVLPHAIDLIAGKTTH